MLPTCTLRHYQPFFIIMRSLAINIWHHFDVDICLVLLVVILHGDCPDDSPQTASARGRARGGHGGGGRMGGGVREWVGGGGTVNSKTGLRITALRAVVFVAQLLVSCLWWWC